MKLNIFAETDTGLVRDHNEDSHLVLGGNKCPPGIDCLLVVADGMGGHAAGEVASQLTVDGINEQLKTTDIPRGNGYGAFLSEVVHQVNKIVWTASQEPSQRGMGTTCTLASICGNKLFLSHVGDSRAYLIRQGNLHQITTDHSWVEEAVMQGILTKEQARVHPNRNAITRAVGLSPNVEVDTSALNIKNGDVLLLCSDGLNSMIEDDHIADIVRTTPIESVCTELIKAANNGGGHDNTTVIAVQIGKRKLSTIGKLDLSSAKTVQITNHSQWWKFWNRNNK